MTYPTTDAARTAGLASAAVEQLRPSLRVSDILRWNPMFPAVTFTADVNLDHCIEEAHREVSFLLEKGDMSADGAMWADMICEEVLYHVAFCVAGVTFASLMFSSDGEGAYKASVVHDGEPMLPGDAPDSVGMSLVRSECDAMATDIHAGLECMSFYWVDWAVVLP